MANKDIGLIVKGLVKLCLSMDNQKLIITIFWKRIDIRGSTV